MKKHFLKSFALLAMLFSALTLSAQSGVDWSTYEFLGDGAGGGVYNNKYKVQTGNGVNVANVQAPGGTLGSVPGIYVSFEGVGDVVSCNLQSYTTQGGGMLMHLYSFTNRETKVTVNCQFGSKEFWVYYADGIEGGSDTPATPSEVYDVNFALTANGSSAEATSGDAAQAIDNNAGSRWESASADPQTWTLDLGQARIFNTLEIVWEGAYGKTFTVSVSDDKENWTPIWTVEGQELAGFPYTQTQKIDKTTARYIQFHGTERGTGYGYSFWEFRVFLLGETTLTTLEATPATQYMHMGEENVITVTAKDQIGKVMENAGEVTYTISPVEAGVINDNVFTPSQNGTATIVAAIGDVKSAPFDIITYVSQLASLEAKPVNGLAKVGEAINIDVTAKDQYEQVMETPDGVTYTITPVDAGTITNNIYTPAKIGLATIVATIGEVSAPAFEVFAYDGENVALSPDINNSKIIAQSAFAPSGTDAWHAIDGNEGSVWQGSATNGTAGDEAARTYDSWFVVDFGGYYDINLVSIKFEGACSQEYHVDFSADNATWNLAYNYVGAANVNEHTKLIYGNDLQNNTKVRYARFYSTKAATQWGMKMFEFKVYGTTWEAPTDTEKPVMGTVSLKSKTYNSAVISVDATDNMGIKAYRVRHGSTFDQTFIPNANGEITLTDLETGDYSLTITAKDLSDNESENSATLEFTIEELIYCNFPTGHESNAAFGDVNGRILVSAIKVTPKNIRLIIKSAEESTKNIDLVYVAPTDAAAVTVGSDVTEGGSREVAVDIEYTTAPATYGYMIQWSNPAWDGRWQASINNISPTQLCTELVEIEDINFALTANGSSAEATTGNAAAAIDNNIEGGSRWESAQEDPQTWTLDLGQARIFNTLEIVWEGAYGKTFTVSVSDDKETWTPVWTVEGQELAGFPYTQTQKIDKTTARYIQFHGTERGTGYGYSFYEFRVYLAGESTFTTLEAKPATNLSKVGEGNAITLTAKDQNGQVMADAGEVTYTITPADAGTITNNIYTPAKIGLATIVATIGEVSAPAFEVFAYDGENVALSPDINNSKIIAQSAFAPSGTDAWHAIDGNEGSVWQGSATNGGAGDEAARTYDSWFIVDFGGYYDINLVTIQFEGACSQEYHVDFSADNATWNQAYNYVGAANVNPHTQRIYGADLQNTNKVRYARFYSTKAATQWGMKIFEFKVFGTPFVASGDTEKPVMETATLVSKTHKSAIIAVSATDNDEVGSYHVVCTNTAYEQTLSPTDGKITLNNLTPATTYNFTITAIDLAGNESENAATVECTTNIYNAKPTSAPTPPTHDAKQVKSVFSDVYGGTFSAMEGWGQATQFEELNFNGDYVRYYTNLNYLGWATGSPINASVMEKLHLDIWAAEDATIIIVPIYGGQGLVTDDQKTKTVTVKGQEWNSIDLTLATDFAGLNLSSIFQFKFDAPQGTDKFAIDNVYFYTTQVSSDVIPPANLKATAIPSFTTAVIECSATDESGSVNFKVMYGAEQKAVGSADSGATARLNITNLQAGSEFTMTVIATDVYGNEAAEPVNVTFTTLTYPAPAPTPIWKAENVFSIYSNAYNTTVTRAFGWGWGPTTVETEETLVQGDQALLYTTSNFAGWELNGNTSIGDLKEYPYLHMDIYVENDGSIQFTPIWAAEALKEYTLEAGWNSIDIDLTAEFAGINLANIYQLKWAAMPATCFIDNVYFYRVVIDEDVDLTQLNNGMAYDVTLKRNFAMGDDGWNTISLPFALNAQQIEDIFGDGTKVTKLTSSNLISSTEIDLQFVEVTAMEAATPYLIHPTNNVDAGALVEDVVINVTPNIIEAGITQMIPVLKTENFTGKDNAFFLGPDDNLYNQSADGKIKALRAYFKFSTLTPAQLNNLRARVVFNENTETGVDNLITDEAPTKMIQNGQLIIIRNGIKYNVQGQKL